MPVPNCRYFNGYKPCSKNATCTTACPSFDKFEESILIIHLGALGAVVRSTSLLASLKRKHPTAKILWLTEKPAMPLLEKNPDIDRVISADHEGLLSLQSFEFSFGYVIDKSLKASGLAQSLKIKSVLGFNSKNGVILPATPAAEELWNLGLDNFEKFFVNQKPETQLLSEALELDYQRQEYNLKLSQDEKKLSQTRAKKWSEGQKKWVIGINTGCSPVIPYKKLTIDFHKKICRALMARDDVQVVLLGGPEDTQRNKEIADGLSVIISDSQSGLRDGLISVTACDVVITGDSLGMHMAISQKKWVVAWFGPTCAQEIDLYERGIKILSKADCAPCWKRSCQKSVMCYDQVNFQEIISGVEKGIQFWLQTSLSKQPFSEISF